MIDVVSSAEIEDPAAVVWQILIDLAHFDAWNPFIRAARGTPIVGATVRVRVRPSFGGRLIFHATVLAREENRELRWRGRVLSSRLACGDHTFTIEPVGEGRVRFVQRETFTGVLPRLVRRLLERETARGFDAMNRALKARAERAEAAPTQSAPATTACRNDSVKGGGA